MSNGGRSGGSMAAGFSIESDDERYDEVNCRGVITEPISLETTTTTTITTFYQRCFSNHSVVFYMKFYIPWFKQSIFPFLIIQLHFTDLVIIPFFIMIMIKKNCSQHGLCNVIDPTLSSMWSSYLLMYDHTVISLCV